MKDLLVGSTGFVGGNLLYSHHFTAGCHSADISEYYGKEPELCVYAGIPAAMFLAASKPEADLEIMKHARENIRKINPIKIVLISTIAVYSKTIDVDESTGMDAGGLAAYGRNRLQLERWIREDRPEALIVRLPALYGRGLKKNFLFDLHNITPSMLGQDKYEELSKKNSLVRRAYSLAANGFYQLNGAVERQELKAFFQDNDFNALSFTDSRSRYQFYNLERLWDDITHAIKNGIRILNITAEPVTAKEVYDYVMGRNDWTNYLDVDPYDYNVRSIYADLFNGQNGYFFSKAQEMEEIKKFMDGWKD